MNRILRMTRIVVSLGAWAVLTLMLSSAALTVPVVGPLLLKAQIGTAVATLTVFTFVVWMIVTLVFGRVYCSTVCPLGTLQDIVARLAGFGQSREGRRHYRWTPPRHVMRLTFLALAAVMVFLGIGLAVSVLDPAGAYGHICRGICAPAIEAVRWAAGYLGLSADRSVQIFTESAAATALAFVILMGVSAASASGGRVVCNTVCPVGTMLGFVSRFSILQMDIDTDLCTNCRKCEDVCKGQCIDLTDHVVDGSRCVNCFDCVDICPNQAIRYTTRRHRLSTPLMQRVAGIAKQPDAALDEGGCTTASSLGNESCNKSTPHNETISPAAPPHNDGGH